MTDPVQTNAHFDITFHLGIPKEDEKHVKKILDLDPHTCKNLRDLTKLVKEQFYTPQAVTEQERTHKLVAKIGDRTLPQSDRLWSIRQRISRETPLIFSWEPKNP